MEFDNAVYQIFEDFRHVYYSIRTDKFYSVMNEVGNLRNLMRLSKATTAETTVYFKIGPYVR